MNICIISHPSDQQAILVEQAVLQKGSTVVPWCWADFPAVTTLSAEFDRQGILHLHDFGITDEPLSIWIHRGLQAVAPDWLHRADINFVRNESREFLHGVLDFLAIHAFCVNPLAAVRQFRYKINQLLLAQQCGLTIPVTLFSNDPERITRFARQHANHTVIKHATQMYWESHNDSLYLPYTTRVSLAELGNTLQLRSCPSIYQVEINKSFELRIVFIGLNLFAAKIDSQHHGDMIDWRNNFGHFPPCEVYALSEAEKYKLLKFIRISGLRHGSIDAIVDQYGEFIFVEINEAGQFLWIEDLIPEFHLLDCFSEFLVRQDPYFVYTPGPEKLSLSDFMPFISTASIQERIKGHVVAPDFAKLVE